MVPLKGLCVCVIFSADWFDDSDGVPHPALHSGVHDAVGLAVCLYRVRGPLRDNGGAAVLVEKVKTSSPLFRITDRHYR